MWIRSQNKKEFIYVNYIRVYKEIIRGFNNANDTVLGEYSTEEKAFKVIEMIEKHINKIEEFKAQGEDIQENYLGYENSKARLMGFIFQMPQDSEVE